MVYDTKEFEHKGLKFRLDVEQDEFMRPPWEEHDGHGPVTGWRAFDSKEACERTLIKDRGEARFYDWQEAIKIAKRDGWGSKKFGWKGDRPLSYYHFLLRHWRKPTAGEFAEAAVQEDFLYLQDWCNDQWWWVDIRVTLLDDEGDDVYFECLGGLQSDDDDGIDDAAHDLAEGMWCSEMERRERRQTEEARAMEEARPDMYATQVPKFLLYVHSEDRSSFEWIDARGVPDHVFFWAEHKL